MTKEKAVAVDSGRIHGSVKRIIPPKKDGRGDPVGGGYIWIEGANGVDYFGHITQIQGGVDIYDIRVGDGCVFTPTDAPKGPAAEHITIDGYDA